MIHARARSGGDVAIDDAAVASLASRVAGRVLDASAVEYDRARRVWNGLIDRYPALIVRCSGVADALTSLRFARDHDLLVAVRGGGHNVAGLGTCDGGLVIDLSPLRGIRVDPEGRTARAQAGATWGDLDRETQVFGLAVPGGVVSTTGIAGLTLGGGNGWLRRTYGMTCDSLLSADVVTSDGARLAASETAHADLFWALRGGGGNFGIVTEFEYRLHAVGPLVTYASAMYAADAAHAVLPAFREYMETAPDAVNGCATFWVVPATPLFPDRLHGRPVIAVSGIYAGDGARGEQILYPLRRFAAPFVDVVEPIPYTSLQRMLDPFFPEHRLRYYWKGLYLDALTEAGVTCLTEGFARRSSPLSMLVVWAQGGALTRVAPHETAVGARHSRFLVEVLANWAEPALTPANIDWARGVCAQMQACTGWRPNVNFPGVDDEMPAFVRAAFGPHYERLAQIKRKYDPNNVFRINQNLT